VIKWPWSGTVPDPETDDPFEIPGHEPEGEAFEDGTVLVRCSCGKFETQRTTPQLAAEETLRHFGAVIADLSPREKRA
jgi:hypothetical protein